MQPKHFLGFYSLTDFIESLIRIKDWSFTSTIALIGVLTTFIGSYMWDDPAAVWTLWSLMIADWITGIWKSMKKKEFVSYKLFRMPLFFVATSFILSISWWMAKASMIFMPLPAMVMCGFLSVNLVSLLENLGELNLLPKTLVTLLSKKFGIKVLYEKFFGDKEQI